MTHDKNCAFYQDGPCNCWMSRVSPCGAETSETAAPEPDTFEREVQRLIASRNAGNVEVTDDLIAGYRRAVDHMAPLRRRIAELEADVRALGGDPDRMVDPRDHEAAMAAMKRDMNSAGAGVGVVSPLKACEIAEEHMLRMAQANLPASAAENPLRYLPLSEVTDGHIRAYLRGAHEAFEQSGQAGFPVMTDQDIIRAGLAAVQWPTREPAPDPKLRQVPVGEVREGDTVTVSMTAHVGHVRGVSGLWLSEFQQGGVPSMFLTLDDFTVSRLVSPLPDQPGAVGTATVRGIPDAPVFRVYSDTEADHRAWVTTGGSVLGGAVWLRNDEVCDFKPAGAGVTEGGIR